MKRIVKEPKLAGEFWPKERLEKHAKRRLDRLRKLVVAGRIGPEIYRPRQSSDESDDGVGAPWVLGRRLFYWCYQNSAVGILLREFHRACLYESTDWMKDTFQAGLMKVLAIKSPNIRDLYNDAQATARGLIFDGVKELLTEDFSLEFGLEDAMYRSALLHGRLDLFENADLAAKVFFRILTEVGPTEWSAPFARASRRQTRKIDLRPLFLGRRWTHGDFPLWLMNESTLLKVCKVLGPGHVWTEATLAQCLSESRLRNRADMPIVDIEFSERSPNKIAAYVVDTEGFAAFGRNPEFEWTWSSRNQGWGDSETIKVIRARVYG